MLPLYLGLIGSCRFKLAPMDVADLIKQCDVIVYALPTRNPYRVKIGQVLLAKKPMSETVIELSVPPPKKPGELEYGLIGPIQQTSILFLRRPNPGKFVWQRVNYYYDLISMKNDHTPSTFYEDYDSSAKKQISYLMVGNLVTFPPSLNRKYRGYATRSDITRVVNNIYKWQTK